MIGKTIPSVLAGLALLLACSCTKTDTSKPFPRVVRLGISLGASTPSAASVNPSAADLAVLQVALSAGEDEQVKVTSIRFTETGTGNAQTAIGSIGLFVDADGNGSYSAVVDTVTLGTVAGGYAADDTVTFSGLSRIIHPGSTERWLLVYTLNGTAAINDTFIASVASAADVTAEGGESGRTAVVEGPPVTGSTFTVQNIGTLTLSLGGSNPVAAFLPAFPATVPMLQVNLEAGATEDVNVTSVTF
ncbi:MAG: hypothetical protein ACYS47_16325, partial [Planctomycetota bacterium]